MSQEDAHIQDSDIMNGTSQVPNDAGTRIQLSYTLSSGKTLTSEFFDPGMKRAAVKAWLPAVRQAILTDDEETRLLAKKNAALAQQTKDVQAAKPVIVDSRGELIEKAPNPVDYVRRMVDSAQLEFDRRTSAYEDAAMQLIEAEKALNVWKTVEQSLGGNISAQGTNVDRTVPYGSGGDIDGMGTERSFVQTGDAASA